MLTARYAELAKSNKPNKRFRSLVSHPVFLSEVQEKVIEVKYRVMAVHSHKEIIEWMW